VTGPPARPGARHRIAIPRLRSGHVTRQRLLDRLDQAHPGDIVLVIAPAGWGKTALLADWLRTDPVHTVWVSLSSTDDSARGFWAILLGALRGCPVVAVGDALHDLVPPHDPAGDADFLAAVADGLHAVAEPLTIVLDNTQDLTDPAAVDGLRSLLRDRPPQVRVVLAGRRDPPIPRGRLRAAGNLVEVRADQLRFCVDEAAGMLAGTRSGGTSWTRWSRRPAGGPRVCGSPRPRSPPRRRPTSSTTWSARTGPCPTTSSRRCSTRSRRRCGTSSTA
jgi:LuxR family maltose regulon positive regulatory protein